MPRYSLDPNVLGHHNRSVDTRAEVPAIMLGPSDRGDETRVVATLTETNLDRKTNSFHLNIGPTD